MATPETIGDGDVVSIHYSLKLDDGQTVDSSSGRDPLQYLHGHGNIVPGLEREIGGKKVGDQLQVTVAPAEGYGERDPAGVQALPRSAFPADVDIQPGMQFQATDPDGNPAMLLVTAATTEEVTVDLNHPLAGQTLHFDIEIVACREATAEELEHGHVHGPGGHQH